MSRMEVKVSENTSYNKDFEFAFKYSRWLLYSMAAWPDLQNSILKVCCRIVSILYIFLIIGGCSLHFITMFNMGDDLQQFIETLGLLNTYTGILLKYIVIIAHKKTIEACIRQMNFDWRYMFENSREIMLKHAKISRYFLLILTSGYLGMCMSWHITVWLQKPTVVNNDTLYELPYVTYFKDIDAQTAPYCFYIYVVHFLCDLVLCLTSCSICIVVTFVMHVCGQYLVLESFVQSFGNEELNDRQLNLYIARFVKRHVSLLR